ncbi:unnamed protein product [Vicia faba]|uniref:Uncharacterized protein n=1 Tax=Vicia faba TaxID=3906 RepID=A0AAV1A0H1_VICFA|nr:unnamed protein product [Vicia faba]
MLGGNLCLISSEEHNGKIHSDVSFIKVEMDGLSNDKEEHDLPNTLHAVFDSGLYPDLVHQRLISDSPIGYYITVFYFRHFIKNEGVGPTVI